MPDYTGNSQSFQTFFHLHRVERPGGGIPPGQSVGVCCLEAVLDYGIVKLHSANLFAFSVTDCVLALPPGGVSVTL